MATVTGLTAARMAEIEAASIVDGQVVGNNLILTRHDETTIDAGNVRGPAGTGGESGAPGTTVHSELSNLSANDHPQYLLAANHTKAAHDSLLIDAATLDGIDSTGFSLTGHNHDATYLNVSGDTMTGDLLMADGAQIDFYDDIGDKIYLYQTSYGIGIEASTLTNWSAMQFRWRLGGGSVSSGSEIALIHSSGLTVQGGITAVGVNAGLVFDSRNNTGAFQWYATAGYAHLYDHLTNLHRFSISNATGNVGIGNTAPSRKLTVVNGSVAERQLRLGYSDSYYWDLGRDNTTGKFHLGDEYGTKITVLNGGQVGIGLTGPAAPLHVYGGMVEGYTLTGGLIYNVALLGSNQDYATATSALMFQTAYTAGYATAGMGSVFVGKENATDGNYASYMGLATRVHAGSVTERVRITSAGYVGIGTAAPAEKLEVTGNIRVSLGYYEGNTYLYFGPGTTMGIGQTFASPGYFTDVLFGAGPGGNNSAFRVMNGSIEVLRANASGKVGIGTTSPGSRLEVSADAQAMDLLTLRSTNVTTPHSWRIGPDSGVAAGGFGIYQDNPAGTRIGISATGRVGIGDGSYSESPAQLQVAPTTAATIGLIVKGYTDQTSDLQQWQDSAGNIKALVSAAGNLSVGTLTSAHNGYTLKTEAYTVDLGLGNQVGGWARAFRVVNNTGSNGYDGGAFGVLGNGNTPSYVYMSIPTSNLTGFDSTKIIAITNGGNVGIGTVAPTAKLEVSGGGVLAYNFVATRSGGLFAYPDLSGTGGLVLGDNGSGANSQIALRSTGEIAVDGNVRLYNDTITLGVGGLRVTGFGYGPTTYRVLQVGASVGVTESVSIGYDPIGITGGAFVGDGREILFRRGAQFATPNAAGTDFYTLNLVLRDGNVGIGTATPERKLHVGSTYLNVTDGSGDIISSGGIIICSPQKLSLDHGHYLHANLWFDSANYSNEYSMKIQGYYGIEFLTRSANNAMVIRGDTGRVGIGTTSPSSKLDIGYTGGFGAAINTQQGSNGYAILFAWYGQKDGYRHAITTGHDGGAGSVSDPNNYIRFSLWNGTQNASDVGNREALRISAAALYSYVPLDMGAQVITNVANPTTGDHVGDRDYNDIRYVQVVNYPNDGVAPAQVTGVVATAGFESLFVEWTANTEADMINGWGNYHIQVDNNADFSSLLYDKKVGSAFAAFSGLPANTLLYIRVRAIDAHGNPSTSWSTTASGTPMQVVAGDLADNSVTTGSLQANAITAGKLAANSVTAAAILAGTITATEIAAGTITGVKIAANAIDTNHILANTIQAGDIAANTITANEIAANAITASELSAFTMEAGKYIRSTSWVSQTAGFSLLADGTAEFNGGNVSIRDSSGVTAIEGGRITLSMGGGGNLLPNSSFETVSLSSPQCGMGWSNYDSGGDGTTYSVPLEGRIDGRCQKIVWTNAATYWKGVYYANNIDAGINSNARPVWKTNQWYTISAWVKASGGAVGQPFYTSSVWNNPPQTVYYLTSTTLTTDWTRVVSRFKWDAGATVESNGRGFIAASVPGLTGTVWIDDVQIEEGTQVTAYSPSNRDQHLRSDFFLRSGNYVTGASGFQIHGDGSAEFRNITARGDIQASSVTANSITAAGIVAGTITATQIAANTITAGQILAGTITATQIAADTITASQIAANAITANELSANAVTAGKILAGTIVAADIAADTITASQIAANAITANELNAGAVTADKIASSIVLASKYIQLGTGSPSGLPATSIHSGNWVSATSGFLLNGATGAAEFNSLTVRGTADIGGTTTISSNALITGALNVTSGSVQGNWASLSTGWKLFSTGSAEFNGALHVGGTATVKGSLIIGNGSAGAVQSDNWVANSLGFKITRTGTAEFNNTLFVAGATTLCGTVTVGWWGYGQLKSETYSAGVSGWSLLPNGSAELNNVIARGHIIADRFSVVDQPNLISNGEFETNVTGWTARSGVTSITRTTTYKHSGAASLEIYTSTDNTNGYVESDYITGIEPGRSYSLNGWTMSAEGNASISVEWYKSDNTLISTSVADATTWSTWRQRRGSFVAPALTAKAKILFGAFWSISYPRVHIRFDDVIFKPVSAVSDINLGTEATLSPAYANETPLPGGVVFAVSTSSDFTLTIPISEVGGAQVFCQAQDVPLEAGRLYKFTVHGRALKINTAGNVWGVKIIVNGVTISDIICGPGATNERWPLNLVGLYTPTSNETVTCTAELYAITASTGNSALISVDAASRTFLMCEDVGYTPLS